MFGNSTGLLLPFYLNLKLIEEIVFELRAVVGAYNGLSSAAAAMKEALCLKQQFWIVNLQNSLFLFKADAWGNPLLFFVSVSVFCITSMKKTLLRNDLMQSLNGEGVISMQGPQIWFDLWSIFWIFSASCIQVAAFLCQWASLAKNSCMFLERRRKVTDYHINIFFFCISSPVLIEVPHFASLRDKEREIQIMRSDNGETWYEHPLIATDDAVAQAMAGTFEGGKPVDSMLSELLFCLAFWFLFWAAYMW